MIYGSASISSREAVIDTFSLSSLRIACIWPAVRANLGRISSKSFCSGSSRSLYSRRIFFSSAAGIACPHTSSRSPASKSHTWSRNAFISLSFVRRRYAASMLPSPRFSSTEANPGYGPRAIHNSLRTLPSQSRRSFQFSVVSPISISTSTAFTS